MITTESYGCKTHDEDAYEGCAMCRLALVHQDVERAVKNNNTLKARLAEAERVLRGSQNVVQRFTMQDPMRKQLWNLANFVYASDYDAQAARLAEAERILRAVYPANDSGIDAVCEHCCHGESWFASRDAFLATADSADAAPFHDALCERRDPSRYACFCDTRKPMAPVEEPK